MTKNCAFAVVLSFEDELQRRLASVAVNSTGLFPDYEGACLQGVLARRSMPQMFTRRGPGPQTCSCEVPPRLWEQAHHSCACGAADAVIEYVTQRLKQAFWRHRCGVSTDGPEV